MITAHLHIGLEKTGTTTIQAFLTKNRAALRECGYLFPRAPGKENHAGLAIIASDSPGDLFALFPLAGLSPETDVAAYRSSLIRNLQAEAQLANCHAVVLSNEHMSSRLRRPNEITSLRNAMLEITDDIHIVVYLRRQDQAILSEYSTRVKSGYTERFSLQPHHAEAYNYETLLDRWSSVFASQQITVRLFEKESFECSDLVSDFLATIRCPQHSSFLGVTPQNTSLDAISLEYLRRLNRYLPAYVDKRYNSARGNIYDELTAISTGAKPRLSGTDAAAIMKLFEESNCNVARRYLGRSNGRLFATQPDVSTETTLFEFNDDLAFDVTARLLRYIREHLPAPKPMKAGGQIMPPESPQ